MKVNTFSKIGICAGAIALVVGAVAVPAQADPAVSTYGELVGLGSDTTQDVVDGLAKAITPIAAATAPVGSMASYNATGDATVVTRAGGVSVPRVNGSSAGRDMLIVAIGGAATKSVAVGSSTVTANKANSVGQIDFARSSSLFSSGGRQDGILTYIPFARDAVTIAIDPDSPLRVVPFVKGTAEVTGEPSLYNIYRGTVKFAYISGAGTTPSPYLYDSAGLTAEAAPVGTTAYAIKPFIPQSGSGTRTYFLAQLGISSLNTDVVKDTFGTPAASVQEHNGAVVDGNNEAIVPFSISQWVAQKNGAATDRTSNAILTYMNAIAPTTGSGTSYKTNPAYAAMVRDVYNIVPSRLADDPNSAISKMFVGATSKVCSNSATIERFGFIPIPSSAAAADKCGSTDAATKRLTAPTASTVALTIADTSISGTEEFSASVTVTGMHDQGGTVEIYDANDNTLGTGVVAAGQTTATFTVKPRAIGTAKLFAYYTPTLPGISGSDTEASLGIDVTVTEEAAQVFISAKKSAKVGAAMNAVVYAPNAAVEGGTVVLKSGAEGSQTTIGTVTLEEGESAASFSFTPKTVSVPLQATYTAPEGSLAGDGIADKTLTVAKGTPVVTATVASVKATVAPKIVVTVTGMAGVKPTGTITVKNGDTVLNTVPATLVPATAGTAATSAVTITLPKLTKGTKSLTVVYTGDSLWSTATKTGVVAKITAK